jgi:hypothetical protein
MATRFRDVDKVVFGSTEIKCVNSVTVAFGSDVLRGRCSAAISERYQGLSNLSVEVTVEAGDPFLPIHPGDKGEIVFVIPGAIATSGIPSDGIEVTVDSCVCTTHSGRVEKDALASGTYVFRGQSPDGLSSPVVIGFGSPSDDDEIGPSSFIRDIASFVWAPLAGPGLTDSDFCPRSFEFSENSELLEDSCQGALWPEYVGITGLNLTASVTGRGIDVGVAAAGEDHGLGAKGSVSFTVSVGSDEDCTSLEPGGGVVLDNMNVNEVSFTATSGDFGEITISWVGHGASGELATVGLRAIAKFT